MLSLDSILNFVIPLAIIGFLIGIIFIKFKEPLMTFFHWVGDLFGAGAEQLNDSTTYTQIVYNK